jgi:N6-L-threonylcarbamoyladenine synthase
MKILAIDTSCDETAAAVTENTTILSNIVWSQASLHTKWGGILPSLAKREHEKHIDWVIKKAVQSAKCKVQKLDAVAVTIGPGLAIALEVGIKKATELAKKHKKPLILVNHTEGHVLSPLAQPKTENYKLPHFAKASRGRQIPNSKSKTQNNPPFTVHGTPITFPAIGIVTSGKHTELIRIEKIGKYKILAQTVDDALGEAFDKAARMLGLGYPGGAILEKFAKEGDSTKFVLPIPLTGQENRMIFSYSGLKTAMFRKVEELKNQNKGLTKTIICDLSAGFQKSAFRHFTRVFEYALSNGLFGNAKQVFAGGGAMANITLRKEIKMLAKKYGLDVFYPYSKKLYGDNAAMIGICAYLNNQNLDSKKLNAKFKKTLVVDRIPNFKIDSC